MDELSRLKRSATPRPDWERCASYLEGGQEKWSELAQGRSSDQLVDVLLAQIAGVDVSELARDDAFQGQVSSKGQNNNHDSTRVCMHTIM